MHKKSLIWMLAMLGSHLGLAQWGGQRSFDFLNVSGNARLAGLGGMNVSLRDRDVNFFMSNPALVSDSLAGFASAGYQFYVADIGQASFAYAHPFKSIGTLLFGVQHMGYGELIGYDAAGQEIGSFKSGETAIIIGKSHQVSNFRLGANLKTVFSNIAGYRASALMMDIGGTFIHPKKELTVGLAIKNLGFVLSEYSDGSSTKVPFDIQVGATFKPEHMPLRFSLTAYNIVLSDGVYDDPADDQDDPGTLDKFLRHINLGAEILFHRNANLLISYNFLRQQELQTENSGGTGFGFGFSIKIKSFDVVLSRNSYSVGNASYGFTVATNIQKMIFKRRMI